MNRSSDKNSVDISANAMQLLPVSLQQLGHKFDHTRERSKVILASSFQQNLVDFESLMLYTKIQPQSFLNSGEEDFQVCHHI